MSDEKGQEDRESPPQEVSTRELPPDTASLEKTPDRSSNDAPAIKAQKDISSRRGHGEKGAVLETFREEDRPTQSPPKDKELPRSKEKKSEVVETFCAEDRNSQGLLDAAEVANASTSPSLASKNGSRRNEKSKAGELAKGRDRKRKPDAKLSRPTRRSTSPKAPSDDDELPDNEEGSHDFDVESQDLSPDMEGAIAPSRPESGGRGSRAIPTAYKVEETIQEAMTIVPEPPATNPEDSKRSDSKRKLSKKRCFILFFVVVVIAVILISVATTRGFGPKNDEISNETTSDNNKGPDVKEPEPEPPEDDLPCPPIPPNLTYSFQSLATEYCDVDSNCWVKVGPDLEGFVDDRFGSSVSFDSSGTRFAVSAKKAHTCAKKKAGIVRVYDVDSLGVFSQVGQDIEGMRGGDDIRGVLSGDGKRVAIGSPNNDGLNDDTNNIGQFRVFELQEGNWTLLGDPVYGAEKKERLGHSLALSFSGNVLASGAIMAPVLGVEKAGVVRVYNYSSDNNTWYQLGSDIHVSDPEFEDKFGWHVSLSDDADILAIGQKTETDETGKGRISVYQYISGDWIPLGKDIEGDDPGEAFGRHIAMSSDGKVIAGSAGANHYNGTHDNRVRVFAFNETDESWYQLGGSITRDVPGLKLSNIFLSRDGKRIAINTGGSSTTGFGHAFVCDFVDGEWLQVGGNITSDFLSHEFGGDVALGRSDGSRLLVGKIDVDKGVVQVYQLQSSQL